MRRSRIASFVATLSLASGLCIFLGTPANADWHDDGHCSVEKGGDPQKQALRYRKHCSTTVRPGQNPEDSKASAQTVSAYDRTAESYFRHAPGCYSSEYLNDEDFGNCERQEERFCGEDGTWVQQIRVRRTDPDTAIENGSRFCVPNTESVSEAAEALRAMQAEGLNQIAPSKAPIHADNGGRGLRGAHTNFYTSAEEITSVKTIAGTESHLRLTPVEFQWDFGDGTTLTTSTPGTSQTEFNQPTPTSHVYDETGQYQVTLTVIYIGEISEDGGRTWTTEPEVFVVESDPLQADIFRSVTRNVAEDCVADPSAWGCGAPGSNGEPTD